MHFSSAVKSLVFISIQCQGIFGKQVFRCPKANKPWPLCGRVLQYDQDKNPTFVGLAKATLQGQTMTCDGITFNKLPADSAMCCKAYFGQSVSTATRDVPDKFLKVSVGAIYGVCEAVPTAKN